MVTLQRERGDQSYTRLVAYVGMTDCEAVGFFYHFWPGTYEAQNRAHRGSGNERDFWVWRLSNNRAAIFLREILPYVRTQRVRTKITLGLEAQSARVASGCIPDPVAYHALQESYFLRMKELNRRGRFLPDGRTVAQYTLPQLSEAAAPDRMPPLLPGVGETTREVKEGIIHESD